MRAALVALAVVFSLAGCGGGDHKTRDGAPRQAAAEENGAEPEGGAGGEEEEQKGLSAIPASDRRAFIQIAVATGELNTGASVLRVKGLARRQDLDALLRIRPLVKALRPYDPRLRLLRVRTLGALSRGIRIRRDRGLARRDADRLIADAKAVLKGLKRYERARPAIGALAPD
jgi:hypothetical protein